jgi:hypothetical protein
MSYARTIRVEFNHCDPAGIVFYPRYFEMTNSVCENFFREVVGYSYHAMMADGSDVIQLSWHDTNEWHPSVDNNGMIVYTRWDYVDRDSDVAHHLWLCYPDGRDPRSFGGSPRRFDLERQVRMYDPEEMHRQRWS